MNSKSGCLVVLAKVDHAGITFLVWEPVFHEVFQLCHSVVIRNFLIRLKLSITHPHIVE